MMDNFRVVIDIIGAVFMICSSAYVCAVILRSSLDKLDNAPKKVIAIKNYIKKKKDLK